ncbi:MAG: hypothetical protein U9N77_11415 [Thermodesulfobacteriota bacterium]|nr:hypothetical protein [Thermodesulfobacteriota bacterium]
MYNTELCNYSDLYDNFLQNESSRYSFQEMTKTLILYGALLISSDSAFNQPQAQVGLPVNISGSDGYIINHIYSSDAPTWSNIDTTYSHVEDMDSDVSETFNVLSKLAFLEGDAIAEKEADQFFSQVQVKTKKIMVKKRS